MSAVEQGFSLSRPIEPNGPSFDILDDAQHELYDIATEYGIPPDKARVILPDSLSMSVLSSVQVRTFWDSFAGSAAAGWVTLLVYIYHNHQLIPSLYR